MIHTTNSAHGWSSVAGGSFFARQQVAKVTQGSWVSTLVEGSTLCHLVAIYASMKMNYRNEDGLAAPSG